MTSHSKKLGEAVWKPEGEEATGWSFDHAMIDIETMSLHPHKAMILSIGMVEFSPEPLDRCRVGSRSLLVLNPVEQLSLGRRVDPGTQEFWAKQSTEARAHWECCAPDKWINASLAVTLVRDFCAGKANVWANGTQFDLSNLIGLKEDVDKRDGYKGGDLWHYQSPRDMRTFVRMTPQTRIMEIGDAMDISGVPHEPVYDCLVQSHQVWQHWSPEMSR